MFYKHAQLHQNRTTLSCTLIGLPTSRQKSPRTASASRASPFALSSRSAAVNASLPCVVRLVGRSRKVGRLQQLQWLRRCPLLGCVVSMWTFHIRRTTASWFTWRRSLKPSKHASTRCWKVPPALARYLAHLCACVVWCGVCLTRMTVGWWTDTVPLVRCRCLAVRPKRLPAGTGSRKCSRQRRHAAPGGRCR